MDQLPHEHRLEPDGAFRGGHDGLEFISPMLASCGDYLSQNGALFVEAGSASQALEEKYPEIPFTWLSTEYDEMVVFMLTAEEIRNYGSVFNNWCEHSGVAK
jgi:ribosomal protein L3 glutamine methyltransferase